MPLLPPLIHLRSRVTRRLCLCTSQVCANPFEVHVQALYWAFGMVTGFVSAPSGGPFPPHFSDTSHPRIAAGTASMAPLRPLEQVTDTRNHGRITTSPTPNPDSHPDHTYLTTPSPYPDHTLALS